MKGKLTDEDDDKNSEEKLRMHFKFFKAGRLCPPNERNIVELENYSQIVREKKRRHSSENGSDENIDDVEVEPPPKKSARISQQTYSNR